MVRIDRYNVNSEVISDESDREFIKDLFKLKQRMSYDKVGTELTDSIKYEKNEKIERNPKISKATLIGFPRKVADMLGFEEFMEYQVKSWEYIDSFFNGQTNENLIVSAPTGFGKTEAVIPAIINKIMEDDSLAIFIFPRRALLVDQIQRITKYKTKNPIKIGLQMSGITPKIEWTIYNDENMKNVTINGNEHNTKIDSLAHTNYHFENDMFEVDYKNENLDSVKINLFKCHCGGSFENLASFQAQYNGKFRTHKKFIAMNHNDSNSYWECNKCGNHIYASFSRDDHIRLKPNILLTTIDSFLSLISDPDMADRIREKLKVVVFDEAHVYNSTYGSHASAIIRKIKDVTTNNILFAGLSATIDMPEKFGMKLFNSGIKVIKPEEPDINRIKDGETYIFVKSGTREIKGHESPLTTPNMIQSTLLIASSTNGKLMAFMDSVDAVSKLARQTNDAYNVKKLYKFRLDDLINQQTSYVGLMCNGFSPTCSDNCRIYALGECWNILRDINGVETAASIDIKNVSSITPIVRSHLEESRFIFTTSELELGIDLPDIKYLVQYDTPYTIFDYLQRKGRAGRDIDIMPVFLFILGEKSNDYVYFSHGSSILEKSYILPLEEKNTILESLYQKLFDYYNSSNQIYEEIKPEGKKDYIAKFIASWLSVIGGNGTNVEFGEFIKENFGITESKLRNINVNDDMKEFKKNGLAKAEMLMNDSKKELDKLLGDFHYTDPLTYIDTNLTNIIDDIKKINADNLLAHVENLNRLKNDVLADIETQQDSSPNVQKLMNELHTLRMEKQIFGNVPLSKKIGEIYDNIYDLTNYNLSDIQKQARELFFKIQCLKELKTGFERTLNAEVIKYIMRANYFYMVPELLSSDGIDAKLPPIPPTNLFSTSSRDIPLMESTYKAIKNIDIRDSIFKYFPFRLNETRADKEKYVVMPEITHEGDKFYFSPDSIIDPLVFRDGNNNNALMPISLKTQTISDDGINGIISYCPDCYKFYSYQRYKCANCNMQLKKVALYAKPNIEYNVVSDKWDSISNNVYISNFSEATILLNGVSLTIRRQYYDSEAKEYRPSRGIIPLEVMARTPYGYKITTNSLKIRISNEIIDELLKKFHDKFPNRPAFTENDVIHTLEHLWLATISIVVGISPDQFMYSSEGNDIIITELQEGGAGYLKAFVEYLSARTKSIVETMHGIIDCEEHKHIDKNMTDEFDKIDFEEISLSEHKKISDIISGRNPEMRGEFPDNYPTCYDGCLYCIGLNSCNYGVEGQFDHLSLYVSEEYLKTIVKKTSDKQEAASMVSSGGVIVDNKDGKYGIFTL